MRTRVDSSEDEQSLGDDASKQGRKINDINANEDITLVNDQVDAEMFNINDLHGEEVFVEKEVADKEVNDEVQKVVEEVVEDTNTTKLIVDAAQVSAAGEANAASIATTKSHEKGKGIMVEEPVKLKKKDQIKIDKEAALKLQAELQAEFDEEQRLYKRELQAEEQQEFIDEEKATLFMQFLEKKESTLQQKQQKKRGTNHQHKLNKEKSCVLLKKMEGKKLKDNKNKSFNSIQKKFDRAFNRVNIIVDFRTELVEELKQLMKIVPGEEEVAIDAIPLAIKSAGIVDWKIHKKGKKSYYQIIRADESSKMYLFFNQLLKSFDREDLEDLYKLVKARYGSTRPVEDLDLLLRGDLKTMFDTTCKR
nr:hypothetical protein [Tanacetum cinerariifolium]